MSHDVRDKDGEGEGGRDKNLDVWDQGMSRTKLVKT